ncbi:hypothetical protein GGG87_05205 [Streptococcus sp. zg-86]|uniref:DUF5105 domain-containing protein n=1 Tax=Streptococcus zhangguiae TaxID=2664091 RepID=A0A6I4RIH7_9STRE|nr:MULTISPECIES: hypothetical protein [unclassified Streptococcus]MTB64392.1 hypothetical protein [Streptococcus sp. zg-86]MTB90702.1 hypothetical protein [Streptococcus sp. zg-36]MWV56303.1 hypothetical protein [Streptococcus sp. zg-70]QTH47480.1 hypothetical protein J5M87_07965 [Streptococcus sp. zg-86]
MRKKQIMAFLILLSTFLLLAACGIASKRLSQTRGSSVESQANEEAVRRDATILLNSVLTANDKGFSSLYGKSYEQWTKQIVFPSQIEAAIQDNGWTPESKYTYQYAKEFEKQQPSEILEHYYETRRDNLKDIQEYRITDVEVSDDKATVTFLSRQINHTATASAINTIYLAVADGTIDVFAALNKANEADSKFKKLHTLVSDFLYYANFSDRLVDHKGISSRLNETPLTEGQYEVSFDLEKNSEDNWVISDKNYRNLVSDLLNYDEKASQARYPDGTAVKDIVN